MKNNSVFCLFIVTALSLSASSPAMEGNEKFFKLMTDRYHEKEIPQKNQALSALKQRQLQLGLIIGRGNNEPNHSPLPREGEITWVYTDCNMSKFENNESKPYIWMNFDSLEQVRMIQSSLFKEICFDWSVLKFFNNLDEVIIELKRLLDESGVLLIPAGEQTGMVSVFVCELNIEDKKYPIRALQCLQNTQQVFELITEKQMSYLKEIFGEKNVTLITGETYPPAPEHPVKYNSYFIVKK